MPEAVIVATGRTPIGRANKGSLVECRPDDLERAGHHVGAREAAPAAQGRGRGRHPRVRAAGGRGGLQRRPRGGVAVGARRRARCHGQPLLLVVAADHPYGRARHPRRRGRRLRGGRRRDREPLHERRVRHRPTQRRVRGGRAADQGARAGPDRALDAAHGTARRLHRHGPDGRERGRVREDQPGGDGRVRAAVPDAGGRIAGERLLRARDHPGDALRRHGGDQGRRAAAQHDARGASPV